MGVVGAGACVDDRDVRKERRCHGQPPAAVATAHNRQRAERGPHVAPTQILLRQYNFTRASLDFFKHVERMNSRPSVFSP